MLPAMFGDNAWSSAMRSKLMEEAQSWRTLLAEYFSIVGYTDLFTLVETEMADSWFHHLASQGILVRRFDYNPRWLRFGLPDAVNLDRLRAVLREKI